MFDPLTQVRDRLADVAATFDPALLTAADCGAVVETATAIERMAAHVKALAAARVAETELWRQRGARSPEEDLARRTGTSVSRAREQLETARRARRQPKVDEAARQGKLSPEQAAAISDAAAADPSAEARLVEGAGQQSLQELRDACGRVKATAADPEERHRKIHAGRRLRTFTDSDGAWNLHLRNTADVGAAIMERLRPVHDRLFAAARKEERREPVEAYAADALTEVVLGSTAAAAGEPAQPVRVASRAAKVIVRIDLDTLLRGYPIDGEVSEISGIGPVPVSVVEAMLATGDPFLAAVVTRGVDVIGVAHLGRKPTDFQVTALQWSHPVCPVEGCGRSKRLEVDHRHDWAHTKVTLLDWLDRLCEHHHDLKTLQGWSLVDGVGTRPMVPPDDPRHPRHARAPATGPPSRAA